ncbi:MAG: proton-conducting transporter membrane subunit, partial [bacterium]|nr:proton-conducting transporter membrane subunit [bacterium]
MSSHSPLLTVAVLLASAFIIVAFRKNAYVSKGVFFGAGLLALFFSLQAVSLVLAVGPHSYVLGNFEAYKGIELVVDGLSAYASLVIALICLPIFWNATFTAQEETKSAAGMYALLSLLAAAMHGIVYAGDIFNLFVFVEISSLAATAIIAIKGTKQSIEATFKYLVMSALGSGSILFAVALLYMITGHLNMGLMRETLSLTASLYPLNYSAAIGLLLVG